MDWTAHMRTKPNAMPSACLARKIVRVGGRINMELRGFGKAHILLGRWVNKDLPGSAR